jgi:lipoprotein-releasing system ATP-binding protein
VDLTIERGRHVALTGESGQGKTTLLALLGGLLRPQSGEILIAGQDLRRLPADAMARFRSRTVGFVFQHHGLLEGLTALENVTLAMQLAGASRSECRRRAHELLEEVGLAGRMDHLPGRLSGGERQRVALARALANRPAVILADEPTGNLDESNGERVLGLLEQARRDYGSTLLIVTHDRTVAARAERRHRLEGGRLRAA